MKLDRTGQTGVDFVLFCRAGICGHWQPGGQREKYYTDRQTDNSRDFTRHSAQVILTSVATSEHVL